MVIIITAITLINNNNHNNNDNNNRKTSGGRPSTPISLNLQICFSFFQYTVLPKHTTLRSSVVQTEAAHQLYRKFTLASLCNAPRGLQQEIRLHLAHLILKEKNTSCIGVVPVVRLIGFMG